MVAASDRRRRGCLRAFAILAASLLGGVAFELIAFALAATDPNGGGPGGVAFVLIVAFGAGFIVTGVTLVSGTLLAWLIRRQFSGRNREDR